MKKIAIVTKKMAMGGVEKTLISMLENIDSEKYDITLFILEEGGELLKQIPQYVHVRLIPGINTSTIDKIKKLLKNLKLFDVIKLIYNNIALKKANTIYKSFIHYSKTLPIIDEKYDLAISYFNPTNFPVIYTINNIKATKKAMWIHSDISSYDDIKYYEKIYNTYDKIFNVSEEGKNKLIKIFPNLEHKTDVFYNIINQNEIIKKGQEGKGFNDEFNGIRILTVGRLSIEKGQHLIPNIVSKLIKDGYNIRWYCIGDGNLRNEIEYSIREKNIEDRLILLGTKENPYSYMKDCDIYVQPSELECYCTTVTEAKCFNKPIVLCDFNASHEQIENYKTGLITKYDDYELYKSIKYIIENEEVRKLFSKNLSKENNNTQNELQKLYSMI